MGQSLVQIYLHVVFSTKHRKPFLKSREHRDRLYAYLAGVCMNQNCQSLVIGGVEDHVHLLIRLGKTIDISTLVQNLKSDSSGWVKRELGISRFYWQPGYGAFSVSPSHVDALTGYIANQEEHHRKETFKQEFLRVCKKYAVEVDERFVWD